MTLLISLLITLILLASIRFSLATFLIPLTDFLHNSCLQRLPSEASALPELKALACGENFSSLQISELFISSGLIHLFVVSGAHLLVIQKIFFLVGSKKSRIYQFLFFALLFFYAAVCEFNAPVTRSLISIFLLSFLINRHLYWPWHFQLLLIGLTTLWFEPLWLQSISLQLSWLAGLGVGMNQNIFKERSFLFKQSIFFFMLFPLLIYLQIPSPLVILTNLAFTPVLELVLFPLSILVWIFPRVYPIFDGLIAVLKIILKSFNLPLQPQLSLPPTYLIILIWGFIFSIHMGLHIAFMHQKQISKASI